MMFASWIGRTFWSTSPRMTLAPRPTRSAKGFSVRNITPPLVVLVKVAPSKPEITTAFATPSTVMARFEASRMTALVRSREAPAGSCTTTMR